MSLGLGIASAISGGGSTAVVTEDYLWSAPTEPDEITLRFASVKTANVVDNNDAWDIDTAGDQGALMPSINTTPNYESDDEGYWVVVAAGTEYTSDAKDTYYGQDGDGHTELTPIAIGNFPIGDGNYV